MPHPNHSCLSPTTPTVRKKPEILFVVSLSKCTSLNYTWVLPIVLKLDVSLKSLSILRFLLSFLFFSLQLVVEEPRSFTWRVSPSLRFCWWHTCCAVQMFLCISCKLAAEREGLIRPGFRAFGKTMVVVCSFSMREVNVWLSLFPWC